MVKCLWVIIMLESINNYELNDKITLKKLIDNGFVLYDTKLTKQIPLTDDIILYINIYFTLNNDLIFDETKDISIIDSAHDKPYYPFYENENFKYLQIVINNYNFKMDELVSEGILKSKEKIKEKK